MIFLKNIHDGICYNLLIKRGIMSQNNKIDEKIKEIIKALDDFSSVELPEIFEQYKKKKITLIADKLDDGLAYYNKDMKMVTINRDFMNKKSEDFELEYILLHEYFHHIEAKSSFLSKKAIFKEHADLYASNVFKRCGEEVPKRFSGKHN